MGECQNCSNRAYFGIQTGQPKVNLAKNFDLAGM